VSFDRVSVRTRLKSISYISRTYSEPYPSNFNLGVGIILTALDQAYTNTSNWSYTEPTPPSWGLDYEQEKMCRLLDKLEDKLESHQSSLEKSLERIEALLNQSISTQTFDQVQETYQLS